MKRYMIVISDEKGEQSAVFTDSRDQAWDTRMDAECGLGYYAEVYEYQMDDDGNESYQFLYN